MPTIAMAAALVALATAIVAVFVAATRSPEPSERAASVDGAQLARLRRDGLAVARDGDRVVGVKVTDAAIRTALGLDEADVITSLQGRTVQREGDVVDALRAATRLEATTVYADVVHAGHSQHLRWELAEKLPPARTLDPPPSVDVPPPSRDPLLDTIKKVDDTHYMLPRSTIERIAADPSPFVKGARAVPAMKNGQLDGIKLYAIRPSSLYAAIGLQNGDTIRAVNGIAVTSIDAAADLYARLKDAKELAIDITRRGTYDLITLTIQ